MPTLNKSPSHSRTVSASSSAEDSRMLPPAGASAAGGLATTAAATSSQSWLSTSADSLPETHPGSPEEDSSLPEPPEPWFWLPEKRLDAPPNEEGWDVGRRLGGGGGGAGGSSPPSSLAAHLQQQQQQQLYSHHSSSTPTLSAAAAAAAAAAGAAGNPLAYFSSSPRLAMPIGQLPDQTSSLDPAATSSIFSSFAAATAGVASGIPASPRMSSSLFSYHPFSSLSSLSTTPRSHPSPHSLSSSALPDLAGLGSGDGSAGGSVGTPRHGRGRSVSSPMTVCRYTSLLFLGPAGGNRLVAGTSTGCIRLVDMCAGRLLSLWQCGLSEPFCTPVTALASAATTTSSSHHQPRFCSPPPSPLRSQPIFPFSPRLPLLSLPSLPPSLPSSFPSFPPSQPCRHVCGASALPLAVRSIRAILHASHCPRLCCHHHLPCPLFLPPTHLSLPASWTCVRVGSSPSGSVVYPSHSAPPCSPLPFSFTFEPTFFPTPSLVDMCAGRLLSLWQCGLSEPFCTPVTALASAATTTSSSRRSSSSSSPSSSSSSSSSAHTRSPVSTKCVSVGFHSGHLAFLDWTTGMVVARVKAHSGRVTGLVPCGEYQLLSSSTDSTIALWDIRRAADVAAVERVVAHTQGITAMVALTPTMLTPSSGGGTSGAGGGLSGVGADLMPPSMTLGRVVMTAAGSHIGVTNVSGLSQIANARTRVKFSSHELVKFHAQQVIDNIQSSRSTPIFSLDLLPYSRLFLAGGEDGIVRVCN
ncbi:unnamed protein product [Closterium sp. Naga37s-1]|nr:unnamed protein product [Closterium sp. Naga37s-1]